MTDVGAICACSLLVTGITFKGMSCIFAASYTRGTQYKNYIDQHIVPRIGNIKLTALTTLQIQKFYNETKVRGAKTWTI